VSPELLARAARVKLVVFDVDGVLTDGGLWYGPDGEVQKRFDVKDGHAMVLARLTGLKVAVLTARTSRIKLAAVFQGRRDKGLALEELCQAMGVTADEVAYMGDDLNDLPPLQKVGVAACPADAVEEVRQVAHFVSTKPGGHGAARQLIELVLKAKGQWDEALRHTGAAPR